MVVSKLCDRRLLVCVCVCVTSLTIDDIMVDNCFTDLTVCFSIQTTIIHLPSSTSAPPHLHLQVNVFVLLSVVCVLLNLAGFILCCQGAQLVSSMTSCRLVRMFCCNILISSKSLGTLLNPVFMFSLISSSFSVSLSRLVRGHELVHIADILQCLATFFDLLFCDIASNVAQKVPKRLL